MQVVLTPAQMREVDEYCIGVLGIPGLVLMENAGRGIADAIEEAWGPVDGKEIAVIAGKGSNGGDGFVAARHLLGRGAVVHIILVGRTSDVKADARANLTALKNILTKSAGAQGSTFSIGTRSLSRRIGVDIIVDALFGTGFNGVPKGPHKQAIEWMNRSRARKISADIPSGLNGENGIAAAATVKANITATMGCAKTGFFANDAQEYCGKIRVVNLGVPRVALKRTMPSTFAVHGRDIRADLPVRKRNANKYSFDRILILAGSRGLTGAAAMTAAAAMKSGAGTVVLGAPSSVYPTLARKLTEVMVKPLAETPEGTLSLHAYEELLPQLKRAGLLIVGPGLGSNIETQKLLYKIFSVYRGKLLVDADGLNAIAAHPSAFRHRAASAVILTPHTGELSRLSGMSSDRIERDRFSAARTFARKSRCTVVLKGPSTLTAESGGTVFINPTGNPGMATAGSGDVLTGIIAGLWSQGICAASACRAGVFLHGRAGDLAGRRSANRSIVATEILSHLPQAFGSLEDIS